ncbi:hypothetical protein ACFE04_006953 [Oxalis oulophora]
MEIESSAATNGAEEGRNDKYCGGRVEGMHLTWRDMSVVMKSFGNNGRGETKTNKYLLNGLSGYAEPCRILAIMGPSGSGKSTLLDALAGRLARNVVMSGNVLVNGKKTRLNYGGLAYVTQEDILLGTLTVRETITYSCHLRLPSTTASGEITSIVEASITEMGLQECADTLIGNWHSKGISGGEKKRLSIALEILTRPHLLFLDEPTTGLDSAAAFFVVQALKNIAQDGRTVVSAIHQPSSEVFALFDDLFLLSGGETVYFGEAKMAAQFFAEAGFPCPQRRNSSDHFLRCINSDFDVVTETLRGSNGISENPKTLDPSTSLPTAHIKSILIKKFVQSEYAENAKARLQEISSIKGLVTEKKRGTEASWWKQLLILTRRSSVNMMRDVGYYQSRIVIYLLMSISVGSIFFDVGYSYNGIFARGACGGFISGFMTFMSIGGFPSFIEEMKVFQKERLNGYYGVAVYTLSNFLSSFPFLAAMSLSTASITHYMVKFRPGIPPFIYICLDLILSIAVIESVMMTIASLVPNYLMGLIIGAGYLGIMMMTAGFFRLFPDLPNIFWRYPVSYVNHASWALQGAYKNDMIGLEFDPLVPGMPKLKGDVILTTMLGISLDHSKWWDLFAVMVILVVYRFLFFAILKIKEKALPFLQTLYTKRAVQLLSKKSSFRQASFRKIPSFPSIGHQVLHSLSSQEGLNSPLH